MTRRLCKIILSAAQILTPKIKSIPNFMAWGKNYKINKNFRLRRGVGSMLNWLRIRKKLKNYRVNRWVKGMLILILMVRGKKTPWISCISWRNQHWEIIRFAFRRRSIGNLHQNEKLKICHIIENYLGRKLRGRNLIMLGRRNIRIALMKWRGGKIGIILICMIIFCLTQNRKNPSNFN